LLTAALLIARLDNEVVNVGDYRDEVDRMAGEVRAAWPDEASESIRLDALDKDLFQENGYHGSRLEYDHPANGHLNRVIDDREGLPITLSVLYMELARRLDLKMEGVGLPGHFVVRFVPIEGEPQLIDVFEGGTKMTREAAAAKVRAITGQPVTEAHLQPAARREIVSRMLRNLLGLAKARSDPAAMLRYIEGLAAVEPTSIQHRGLRALLRHQNGRRAAAVADLDWIIDQQPAGLDLDQLLQMRARFEEALP
jgi:regulator of sirC expression with transglutaminase-like and TPR domain